MAITSDTLTVVLVTLAGLAILLALRFRSERDKAQMFSLDLLARTLQLVDRLSQALEEKGGDPRAVCDQIKQEWLQERE